MKRDNSTGKPADFYTRGKARFDAMLTPLSIESKVEEDRRIMHEQNNHHLRAIKERESQEHAASAILSAPVDLSGPWEHIEMWTDPRGLPHHTNRRTP